MRALAMTGIGHGRLDPLDQRRVAHPGHAAVAADVGRHPLEGHDGHRAGILGHLGLLGVDHVHDHAATEHLGESPLDGEGAGRAVGRGSLAHRPSLAVVPAAPAGPWGPAGADRSTTRPGRPGAGTATVRRDPGRRRPRPVGGSGLQGGLDLELDVDLLATTTPPVSRAALNDTPKSSRLIDVVALKPTRWLP